ncbi:hypothetical protein LguiB_025173 [Lonicera macranthoides]
MEGRVVGERDAGEKVKTVIHKVNRGGGVHRERKSSVERRVTEEGLYYEVSGPIFTNFTAIDHE